ncbi:putative ribonuclease H-like domain-containing protein, partial [Tanacetum coccineum]
MRPFMYPITILNTIDHLGKFNGKADEGFFVGYSTNSKAFRVFNSRTRIVEENLHVKFSKNAPNIAGSGPNWLFDIDALTKSMNYKPVIVGNLSNGSAGTKDYILLPLWTQDLPFSSISKESPDVGFKPSREEEKKDVEGPRNEVNKVPRQESQSDDQEKADSTNTISAASPNEVNVVGAKISLTLLDDPNMPNLEDSVYLDDDEDVGAEADMNNLNTFILVSPILPTKIHKDYPVKQIIKDLHLSPQTRRMKKSVAGHDLSWIQAMQDELLQFKLQQVWTLVDLPYGKRAIGTKWIYRNKKYERGIVVKIKARLVAQGYTQEEGIDYDEVFAPVARIKAIRLFLAYASFKDFIVYKMDVKSTFLYGKIEEEVYVCQPLGFEDPEFPDRFYKRGQIDKTLFIKRFKGELTFFLGLQVTQKVDGIFISQDNYVDEILKKFGFSTVKTASTPMETSKPLMKDENAEDVDVHLYRSMIG